MTGGYKPFTPKGTKSKHHGQLCRQEEAGDSSWLSLLGSGTATFAVRSSGCLEVSMVTSFSAGILI